MKSFLKKIEDLNRRFFYSILKFFLKNKPITLPINKNKIKKILIFRYDVIGDMIVTTPIFRLIKKSLPEVQLDVYCSAKNYIIIKDNPYINNTFIYETNIFKRFFQILELRKNCYDIIFAFVFHRTTKSGILSNLIGQKHTIKVTLGDEKRNHLYSVFFNVLYIPEKRGYITMSECLAEITSKVLGINYKREELKSELFFGNQKKENANLFINNILNKNEIKNDKKFILFYNISARFRWNINKNIDFINLILNNNLNNFLIILSYSPDDYLNAMEIIKKVNSADKVFLLPKGLDILDISAFIHCVDAVFTPDTSIVHIADAVNKPVFIIYSKRGSYIKEWMPLNTKYKVIISNTDDFSDISPSECIKEFCSFLNEINN